MQPILGNSACCSPSWEKFSLRPLPGGSHQRSDAFPPPLSRGGTGGFCPAYWGDTPHGRPSSSQSAPGGLHCPKVRILRGGLGLEGSHLHRHHRSHQGSGAFCPDKRKSAGDALRLQVHQSRNPYGAAEKCPAPWRVSIDRRFLPWDGNELLLSVYPGDRRGTS